MPEPAPDRVSSAASAHTPTPMSQSHLNRQRDRESARADRRACFSGCGPAVSVPRDVRALADAIDARALPGLLDRRGRPREAYADVRVGHAGDEFERARRMLARGMPHTELTDAYGVSRAPVLAADRAG